MLTERILNEETLHELRPLADPPFERSRTGGSAVRAASDTICSRLLRQARERPDAPAFYVREQGAWKATRWAEYARAVSRAARGLIALGLEPGQTVSILGFNRPEWAVMDVACMAAGGAPAGVYTTCSPEEVAYVVAHAASPLVLVENASQHAKIRAQRESLPALKHVIMMAGAKPEDGALSWEAFLALGDRVSEHEYLERVAALEPDGLATLIYTSGTTGAPKGVMLSHENLAWTAGTASKIIGMQPDDCLLSYLPLSHIAEQMLTMHCPITTGAAVYFAESLEALAANMKEVQPTIFFGVPRIWEKLRAGIESKLAQARGMKAMLAAWAMGVGERVAAKRSAGRKPGGVSYWLAHKLLYAKLKTAVGLGRARVCLTGAAPIALQVLQFFSKLDITVLEIYGQSEDSGPTSFNHETVFKLGTVGPILPGVRLRIAEDDEILVQGPNVFMGYYKDEAATSATLREGWLHSGDLGAFDGEFLKIIGRKKEIIVTSGGKNVSPKNIEAALKNHPLINEAVVIGDRRKFLSALVAIDPEAAAGWASRRGGSLGALHQDEALRAHVQEHVEALNQKLARVEQVKKFAILPRSLSVEDGELTPTLKIKRRVVSEHFADEIEAMYTD
jgi:long-chain acyl-CoA synthetase